MFSRSVSCSKIILLHLFSFGRTMSSKTFPSALATNSKDFFFRQLFDTTSSTYTYLLADSNAGVAVLIDPVLEKVERDEALINELGFKLRYALNTHVHADHITGTGKLKTLFPECESVISESSKAVADVKLRPGDFVQFGRHRLDFRSTPGHTEGCVTYVCEEQGVAFTGDALLIRGCGRTDFQGGDSKTLYNSVHTQIFTLPDNFRLFAAHDYKGLTSTTVWEEKLYNSRLTKPLDEFIKIMANLNLAYPRMIGSSEPQAATLSIYPPVELGEIYGCTPNSNSYLHFVGQPLYCRISRQLKLNQNMESVYLPTTDVSFSDLLYASSTPIIDVAVPANRVCGIQE